MTICSQHSSAQLAGAILGLLCLSSLWTWYRAPVCSSVLELLGGLYEPSPFELHKDCRLSEPVSKSKELMTHELSEHMETLRRALGQPN